MESSVRKALNICLAFLVLIYLVFLGAYTLAYFNLIAIFLSPQTSSMIINIFVLIWTGVTAWFFYAFTPPSLQKIPAAFCLAAFLCGIVFFKTVQILYGVETRIFSYSLLLFISLLPVFFIKYADPFRPVNILMITTMAAACYMVIGAILPVIYITALGVATGVILPLYQNRCGTKNAFAGNTDGNYAKNWLSSCLSDTFTLYRNVTLPDAHLDKEYPPDTDFVVAGREGIFSIMILEWNGKVSGNMYAPQWSVSTDKGRPVKMDNPLDTASLFALCLTAYLDPLVEKAGAIPLVVAMPQLHLPGQWKRKNTNLLMAEEFTQALSQYKPVYTEEELEILKKALSGMERE